MDEQPLYHEDLRPQFHFTARYWDDKRLHPQEHQEGWINDLNGLIYYEGEYHLFAQRWATCWLHAVSTDLVHWTELEPAFWEESEGSGVQSGTCIIDYQNTSGLSDDPATPPMVAFWSRFDNKSQCLCYSLDKGRTWHRYAKNPFMVKRERDPKVFWYAPGGHWVMVMYGDGAYHFLTSPNLLDWTDTGNPISNSFECPDMFELPVDGDPQQMKWVLIQGDGQYTVGSFDGKAFTEESPRLSCDVGPNFYATQSWENMQTSDGRRVQAAWMRHSRFPQMPFTQQISFPCVLTLHQTAEGIRLFREPITEVENLHAGSITQGPLTVTPEAPVELVGDGDLFRVRAQVSIPEGSSLVITVCGEDVTLSPHAVRSRVSETSLQEAVEYIEILVDRGSVEFYVNHGAASATGFILPEGKGVSIRAVGGPVDVASIEVNPLKSIWPKVG